MANHISHAALPYPVKNARFTVLVPYLDADGDPTDPTTPDTEVSQDGGAFADAAEEVTTISGSNGCGYITLSGAETNNSAVAVAFKVASGPKATLMTLYPRVLPVEHSGTAQAGAAGTITLAAGASAIDDYYNGCVIKTTGGTGGGGTGGANNQARVITDYNGSTKVATISPNWETNPSSDTTYEVLLTDMACNALRALRPTVDQRTLDVSAGGEAGVDWANVGSPTTTVNLSGTTVKTATDVETDTQDIQSRLPTALVSGRIDASVGAMAANTLTASALASDAVTEIQSGLSTLTAAQVQTECEEALQTYHLDHLIASADPGSIVANSSLWAALVSKSATPAYSSYNNTTDSLEALRDRGDAAWTTATGFSTHTAADVWAVATRTLTAATNITSTGGTITVSSGSVSVYDFTTAAKALLQTEAEDALVTHRLDELLNADSDIDGAAPPTVGSVFFELMTKTTGSFTFDQTTDALEAIRDNMGTAQTGDAYAVVNSGTHGNAALKTLIDTIDDFLDTEIAAIKAVTDQLTAAQAEPSSVPAANATPLAKIAWLAALARNKITQTATQQLLRNDGDSATIGTSTLSDDGTTFTRGKFS